MILWTKKALRFLEELDGKTRNRILSAVSSLPLGDVKPLKGKLKGLYRLRIGKWRVIFMRDGNDFIILDIRHRKDAYH